MNKKYISLILGFMCFFLTVGIFIQVKTVKSTLKVVAKTTTEAELRNNILRYQERYDQKFKELEKSNKKLDRIIENLSKSNEHSTEYPAELKKLNTLLGLTTVEGPGLVITVQDGDISSVKGMISNFWVHDGDLFTIVNLLKSGGAEAISINDERIISTTAITCAGNIVKINQRKVGSPFVIKAIGLTEKLKGAVTVSDSYLKDMEMQGVKIDIHREDKIKIEKYNGIYTYNYTQNVE